MKMIGIVVRGAMLALAAGSVAAQPVDDNQPDPSPVPKAPTGVAHSYAAEFRTDTLELPLSPAGGDDSEVEYFVRMKAGETLVYDWSLEGAPAAEEFYSDFHGMTAVTPPMQVLSYREGMGAGAKGALEAPFDGLHGWLFKNDSARPVTVKLTIAGFYELRSLRESMGLEGPEFVPFGPPSWPDRYGPVQER
jgi:hypothetical protein